MTTYGNDDSRFRCYVSADKDKYETRGVTITREQFRADSRRWFDYASETGAVTITDDLGTKRLILTTARVVAT